MSATGTFGGLHRSRQELKKLLNACETEGIAQLEGHQKHQLNKTFLPSYHPSACHPTLGEPEATKQAEESGQGKRAKKSSFPPLVCGISGRA